MKHNSTWTTRPLFAPILTLVFTLTSASLLIAQPNASPALEEHKAVLEPLHHGQIRISNRRDNSWPRI
jgi:hypothetical protein